MVGYNECPDFLMVMSLNNILSYMQQCNSGYNFVGTIAGSLSFPSS